MPQEYSPAEEVKDIAEDLIQAHHKHLEFIRIEYIFVSKAPNKNGKEVWGQAKKMGGLNAWLAGRDQGYEASAPEEFFVIEISKPIWDQLDAKSRKALVDHELCHLDTEPETGKLCLRGHDLEEFNIIVRRYGLWRDDVKLFHEAATQKELSDKNQRGFDRVTMKVGDKEVDVTGIV